MDALEAIRAPWRLPGALVRAADDLHAVAERARRDPNPVDEVQALLEALLVEIRSLNVRAEAVNDTGREIVTGGEELTENAAVIAVHLTVFREALPRLLQALETVEDLETSMETVADTVEPLQGVANGVGRVTRRFSAQD